MMLPWAWLGDLHFVDLPDIYIKRLKILKATPNYKPGCDCILPGFDSFDTPLEWLFVHRL